MNIVGVAAVSSGAHTYIRLHRYIMLSYMYTVYIHYVRISVGRDSVVGIATRYGLDGPDIESWWGARFSALDQTGPGAHPDSYTMGTGSLPGVKRPGRDDDHPLTHI